MHYLSDLLTWRFSLGLVVGLVIGIALMFRLTAEAAAAVRRRLSAGWPAERSVEIIRQIVAKEMSGPGVRDQAARLAANVFIVAITVDARPRT